MRKALSVGFGLIAFTQLGATCNSETRPEAATVDAKPVAPAPVVAPTKENKKPVADDGPMPTQDDLPGYPLDQVVGPTARQIFALARDGFSYDGCPGSLADCLHQKPYQRHALRALTLATRMASEGRRNTELNAILNRYYGSFGAKDRVPLDEAAAPCRGPATAAVTLVEFSDFECPHCAAARPLLEEAAARSDVRLCFKPFPLNFHEHARPAAEAALFARDHGKFWEMHDTLFEHQQALDGASLVQYANDLGLDGAALQVALKTNAHNAEINASRATGDAAKVTGTPAVFVNGRAIDLPLSRENLAQAIDDELEYVAGHGQFKPDAP